MVTTRYNVALNTFQDIINALRYVLLTQNTEQIGSISTEDELIFWINKCYALLEMYDWNWARKKCSTPLVTVSGQSLYQLPLDCRDKKPIDIIYLPGSEDAPLKCVESFKEYISEIASRDSTSNNEPGNPRRYCYMEKYETTRSYSTGTVSIASIGDFQITGSGTLWLTNLFCGSTITIGANTYTVNNVVNDGLINITSAALATATNSAYTSSTSYPLVQIDLDPIPDDVLSYYYYYFRRFTPMVTGTDVPILPLNDRWVLCDGAYSLYKWYHYEPGLSGIQPSTNINSKDQFLTAPGTIQKFFDQYVSKLLADDKQLTSSRKKIQFKKGYYNR